MKKGLFLILLFMVMVNYGFGLQTAIKSKYCVDSTAVNIDTTGTSPTLNLYFTDQVTGSKTLAELAPFTATITSPTVSGQLLIYDGSDSWDNKTMSGEATINSSGVLSIPYVDQDVTQTGSPTFRPRVTINDNGAIPGSLVLEGAIGPSAGGYIKWQDYYSAAAKLGYTWIQSDGSHQYFVWDADSTASLGEAYVMFDTGDASFNDMAIAGTLGVDGITTLTGDAVFGGNLTLGTTQWNSGDDINGEQVADNSLDEDAPDWGIGTGQINAADIPTTYVSGATYTTIQDWLNSTQSAGLISGGAITDGGSGTVDVAAGTGLFKKSDSVLAETVFGDWDTTTSVALTDASTNKIYVQYGNPCTVHATVGSLTYTNQIPIGNAYRDGTTVHTVSAGTRIYNATRRGHKRARELRAWERASGLVVADEGNRNFSVTAGVVYAGWNRRELSAVDTSGTGTYTLYYRDSPSGWKTETDKTQIDVTHYDDGDGITDTLTPNRYGVHWVYIDHDSHAFVQLGQGDYKLAEAQVAQPPDAPAFLDDFAILVAKIIIKQGTDAFVEIESAFPFVFIPSVVINHNDLGSLQGGSADERYHLALSPYTELIEWLDDATLGNDGAISITAPITVNSIEIIGADGEVNKATVENSGNWDDAHTTVAAWLTQDISTDTSPTFSGVRANYNLDTSTYWWLPYNAGLQVNNANAAGDAILNLEGNSGTGRIIYGDNSAADRLLISARQADGDVTKGVYINKDGWIGLGTTPTAKLHVDASTGVQIAIDAADENIPSLYFLHEHIVKGAIDIEATPTHDMRFFRNDGSWYEAMRIKNDSGDVIFAEDIDLQDDKKILLGTGDDGEIYVDSNDNLYIDNITTDKDIYIRGNDGGTQYNAIKIDSSVGYVYFYDNAGSYYMINPGNPGSCLVNSNSHSIIKLGSSMGELYATGNALKWYDQDSNTQENWIKIYYGQVAVGKYIQLWHNGTDSVIADFGGSVVKIDDPLTVMGNAVIDSATTDSSDLDFRGNDNSDVDMTLFDDVESSAVYSLKLHNDNDQTIFDIDQDGDITCVGAFFPRQVTYVISMDNDIAGTKGEIVFSLQDSKFYGCTATGAAGAATWAAFH